MAVHDPMTASLQSGLAAELRHIRARLERLAEVLVTDPHFTHRYIEALQDFDYMIQCADENAAVLDRLAGGTDPTAAVAPVRLGEIQGRLQAAMTIARAA